MQNRCTRCRRCVKVSLGGAESKVMGLAGYALQVRLRAWMECGECGMEVAEWVEDVDVPFEPDSCCGNPAYAMEARPEAAMTQWLKDWVDREVRKGVVRRFAITNPRYYRTVRRIKFSCLVGCACCGATVARASYTVDVPASDFCALRER